MARFRGPQFFTDGWNFTWVAAIVAIAAFSACRGPEASKQSKTSTSDASASAETGSPEKDAAKAPSPKAPSPEAPSPEAPSPGVADADIEEASEIVEESPQAKAEDPIVPLLKLLRDKAEEHLAWNRDLLAREEELKKQRQALSEEMARLGVLASVPETHDDSQVEAEWRGLAQVMQFTIDSWMISKTVFDQPALPNEVPADKEFRLAAADVRSVYQIVMKIPMMTDEQLARLLDGIAGFQRLTLVRRVKPEVGGKLTVNAEVYLFNPVDKPRFVVPERSVEAAMAELGIHLTLSQAVRKDPIGYVQTATLAYRELEASRKKAQEVAALQGEVLWLSERMAFWKLKTEERKSVTVERAKQARTVGDR